MSIEGLQSQEDQRIIIYHYGYDNAEVAFDPDQLRHARLRDRAATSHPMEAVMRNVTARVIARPASHGIAMEWSMALWVLALAFLLATLQVY